MALSHLYYGRLSARHYGPKTVFHRPASHDHVECRVVFHTGATTVALPAQRAAGQLKGMFFLCLVSTLYFIHGVLNVFDPALFYWGAAELFFALGLCGITALYVRKLREFNAANDVEDPADQ